MKRLIISISAGIVTALVLVQLYCYFLHPEINFYRNAVAISTSWEEQPHTQSSYLLPFPHCSQQLKSLTTVSLST